MRALAIASPRSTRSGLRAVALLVAFTFGCATVRVPASAIDPAVPVHDGAAEPQVELWLESGRRVTPEEAAQATAEARAALEQALSSRRVSEGEQLLVVRAQGVSRTDSRRSDQHAAMAGIAVGAIVIVAAVVVALVAGKGGGKGGGGGKVAGKAGGKAGGRAVASGIRPAPVRVAAAPRPAPPPGPAPRPAPGTAVRPPPISRRSSHVAVGVSADVQVPYPVAQEGAPGASYQYLGRVSEPATASGQGAGELTLPPPEPLEVDRRGFFAKDLLRLELTLVDRHTGAPLWVKTVEAQTDPRDAAAVQALLDAALDDPSGWIAAAARA